MMRQQFTIPQQFMVGDIKIDTKAQLGRKYTRLLIDAFVPYQEAMLAYLDEFRCHPESCVQVNTKQARREIYNLMRLVMLAHRVNLSRVDERNRIADNPKCFIIGNCYPGPQRKNTSSRTSLSSGLFAFRSCDYFLL